MKKNIIGSAIIVVIVVLISVMIFKSYSIVSKKNKIREELAVLPKIPLVDLDSSSYLIKNSDHDLIVIYFNTTCDLCQFEAIDIRNNITSFSNINLLFISSEYIKEIKEFRDEYKLDGQNIHFTKINPASVFPTFGSLSTPHIFLYNDENKLIKEFPGQTKVKEILKYIE